MARQDCEHLPLALSLEASQYAMFRAWASKKMGENTMQCSQLKSVIHGRCYLREEFEFPGVTPLIDFIHVLCYFVMFVYL